MVVVEGFKLFFEREVPLELRTYDGTNFPTEVTGTQLIVLYTCCTLGAQKLANGYGAYYGIYLLFRLEHWRL